MSQTKKFIVKSIATIIILATAIIMTFSVVSDNNSRYDHLIGRQVGPWNGQVVGNVQEYKGEYAMNAVLDEGSGLLLTNELQDMFDVPKGVNVHFWGTIESFSPLVIHVDGIGW